MSFRLSPVDLCMADAMPFQQHHEARVYGRNLEDVLTPSLLLNVRSNIQVGDEVVICGYADHTMRRLTQFVRVRVFSTQKDGVNFMVDGKVTDIPAVEGDPEPVKAEPMLEVARGLRCFNVLGKGVVLETFRTKAEAQTWADAHNSAG